MGRSIIPQFPPLLFKKKNLRDPTFTKLILSPQNRTPRGYESCVTQSVHQSNLSLHVPRSRAKVNRVSHNQSTGQIYLTASLDLFLIHASNWFQTSTLSFLIMTFKLGDKPTILLPSAISTIACTLYEKSS